MMKNKKWIFILVILIGAGGFLFFGLKSGKKQDNNTRIIKPVMGDIELTVTTTGIVEPLNRLEIKPSIGGRIEEILVEEGDEVKVGDILAWMSSTERAALVDAARSQGEEALAYWEEVYKKTPVISPIDGEVIVRSVEPGQTVTTAEAILVLSSRLMINAQFDETDIGRVKVGQKALIVLDAYPDVSLEGVVDHIAYESKVVNNVTIYEADIIPKQTPEILRSGMSVTVTILEKFKKDVMILPSGAIHNDGEKQFVFIKNGNGNSARKDISVGLNNDKTAEIIAGLGIDDNVVIKEGGYSPAKRKADSSPFMPNRRRDR